MKTPRSNELQLPVNLLDKSSKFKVMVRSEKHSFLTATRWFFNKLIRKPEWSVDERSKASVEACFGPGACSPSACGDCIDLLWLLWSAVTVSILRGPVFKTTVYRHGNDSPSCTRLSLFIYSVMYSKTVTSDQFHGFARRLIRLSFIIAGFTRGGGGGGWI